jgi:hypothetical protein
MKTNKISLHIQLRRRKNSWSDWPLSVLVGRSHPTKLISIFQLGPGKQGFAAGFFYVGLNYRGDVGRNRFIGEFFAQLAALRIMRITRRDC